MFSAAHLGAMTLAAVVPLDWGWRILLWALLGWSFYHCWRTHALRSGPAAITSIELDNEGVASVRFAGSETWQPVSVISYFVHPWITVMSLRPEGRRWPMNLVLAADAVEPEPFRRWRVALTLQALKA